MRKRNRSRCLVLAVALCACVAHAAQTDQASEELPAKAAAKTSESAESSPVLRANAKFIQSSNLLASARNSESTPAPQKWEVLFELAQQQLAQKDYIQAARNFAALVENGTTEEMKRSALLELAVVAQEQDQLAKAQQILAQYLKRY